MILDVTVKLKVCASNHAWWKGKGYTLPSVGGRGGKNGAHEIEVKVGDLSEKSNVRVNCKCDNCGVLYTNRYSRNTDHCAKCIISLRMKGNIHGSLKRTMPIPSKEELQTLIDSGAGKVEIAKQYGATIIMVTGWIKHHSLDVMAYRGLVVDVPADFLNYYNTNNPSMRQIYEKYNVSRPCVVRWMKDLTIYKQFLHRRSALEKFEFQQWSNEVRQESEKTYRKFKHVLNPNNLPRKKYAEDGYHLDHKISLKEGFEQNISIETMSSLENLQMLTCKENRSKFTRSI